MRAKPQQAIFKRRGDIFMRGDWVEGSASRQLS